MEPVPLEPSMQKSDDHGGPVYRDAIRTLRYKI